MSGKRAVVDKSLAPASGFHMVLPPPAERQTLLWTVVPNGRSEKGKLRLSVVVAPRLEILQGGDEGPLRVLFPDFSDWPRWLKDTVWGEFQVEFVSRTKKLGMRKLYPATHASAQPDSEAWRAIFPDSTIVRSYAFTPKSVNLNPVAMDNRDLIHSVRGLYSYIGLGSMANPPSSIDLLKVQTFQDLANMVAPTLGMAGVGTARGPAATLGASYGASFGGVEKNTGPGGVLNMNTFSPMVITLPPAVMVGAGLAPAAMVNPRLHRREEIMTSTSSIPFKPLFQSNVAKAYQSLIRPPTRVKNPMLNPAFKPHIYDFHEIVTFLRDYPDMMRRLGLVLDLEVDAPVADVYGVRIQHKNLGTVGNTKYNATPLTICRVDDRGFAAEPRTSKGPQRGGMLRLDDIKSFDPIQLDTDGGGIKLMQFAAQFLQAQSKGSDNTPKSNALPSMRSVGIGVHMNERASYQMKLMDRATTLENELFLRDPPHKKNGRIVGVSNDLTLYAEDITRGYRIDAGVLNKTTSSWKWYSLCRRNVIFNYGSGEMPPVADEGTVTSGLTKMGDNKQGLTHELMDALFRWDGWSLCVARPGDTDVHLGFTESTSAQGLHLHTKLSVQDFSLPRLRFGRSYRFRARTVDIAGNSLLPPDAPLDKDSLPKDIPDKEIGPTTAASTYLRYEPIGSPLVILTQALDDSPGESLETVVIRSGEGIAPGSTSERHLAPPRITPSLAETHGKFDGPIHLDKDKRAAAKDAVKAKVPDVVTEDQVAIKYLPDPLAAGVAFGHLPGTKELVQYYFYDDDPDPEHHKDRDALFTGLASDWPHRKSLRIKVQAGSAPPQVKDKEIIVSLPPAEVVHVPYASVPAGEDAIRLMAVWQWVEDEYVAQKKAGKYPKAQLDQFYAAAKKWALEGVHWMLTPRRDLMLVHAVKQPLVAPEVVPVFDPSSDRRKVMRRDLHSTWSYVDAVITTHGKSTVRVDLTATWQEYVNDPENQDGYRKVPVENHVLGVPVHLDYLGYPTTSGGLAYYYDTIPSKHDVGGLFLGAFIDQAVVEPARKNSAAVKQENKDALTVATRYGLAKKWKGAAKGLAQVGVPRHEFGDTKHRVVTYSATGVTRFREYFKPMRDTTSPGKNSTTVKIGGQSVGIGPAKPVFPGAENEVEKQFTRTGGTVAVHIPNSARPGLLKPAYIVPTFGWEPVAKSGGGQSRMRKGNGLRIYLEGPWFLSGEDEMLGVVLLPKAVKGMARFFTGTAPDAAPHVTRWAQDPIWTSKPLPGDFPSHSDFVGADDHAAGLTLAELETQGGGSVDVVGYKVQFDASRGLWFADVEFTQRDTYLPFIRLALVRYQPYSVRHAHLSHVAMADFVQLTPDRRASFTTHVHGGGSEYLRVSVSGVSYGNKNPSGNQRGKSTVFSLSNAAKVATGGTSAAEQIAGKALLKGGAALVKKAFSRKVDTGSVVEASLEQVRPGVKDPDLKWEAVNGTTVKLDATMSNVLHNEEYTWSGDVNLPAGGPYRLVIREYEIYLREEGGEQVRRLVYAEAFEL